MTEIEPYYAAEDINLLERLVQRNVFDDGYKAHRVGLLLKDCPWYNHPKWMRWWRAGWRVRSAEEQAKRPKHTLASSPSSMRSKAGG